MPCIIQRRTSDVQRGLQAGSLGPVPHTLPHRPHGDDHVLSPRLTGTGAIPPHRSVLSTILPDWLFDHIIAPQFVKPSVKSNKNDPADAEAICEAVTRPTMRLVPIKAIEQQDL